MDVEALLWTVDGERDGVGEALSWCWDWLRNAILLEMNALAASIAPTQERHRIDQRRVSSPVTHGLVDVTPILPYS